MKQIKVSELSGAALDYCVAVCEGNRTNNVNYYLEWFHNENRQFSQYRPSSDWSRGGPIIEREGITLINEVHMRPSSEGWRGQCNVAILTGSNPLTAAMRCYVASKLGEVVEISEDLC